MENKLLPNNITLESLRLLLAKGRDILGEKVAVNVGLSLWHYDSAGTNRIVEKIEFYYSSGGPTEEFKTFEEVYDYLEQLKKINEGEE